MFATVSTTQILPMKLLREINNNIKKIHIRAGENRTDLRYKSIPPSWCMCYHIFQKKKMCRFGPKKISAGSSYHGK